MDNIGGAEMILIVMLVLAIFLIPTIFFLISQQNLLKAISPQNRKMSPGEVWLQLIPLFGTVWKFIVVNRIADSIRDEIYIRTSSDSLLDLPDPVFAADMGTRPTFEIGITYCILGLCTFVPLLGYFAAIGALVCWIIYWVKIVEYKNKFNQHTYNNNISSHSVL